MRIGEELTVDWDDPADRGALLLYALSYNTPETVAGMVAAPAGRAEMAKTWAKVDGPTRHLFRRRARLIVDLPAAAASVDPWIERAVLVARTAALMLTPGAPTHGQRLTLSGHPSHAARPTTAGRDRRVGPPTTRREAACRGRG